LREFEGEVPVLDIPLDYLRPVVQSFEGSNVSFEVGIEKTKLLNKIALEEGVTLYMVLLSITNIFLSKISSQEDIIIGTPVAARRHADLKQIIGMFVNTLALRNYPNGEKTFKNFLLSVKERTLGAFENQEYPFEDLVDKVAAHRDTSRSPLFDIMFVLQNIETPTKDIPEANTSSGKKSRPHDAYESMTSKFDLTFIGVESREKILFTLEYCTKLFKKETIEKFLRYLEAILNSILNDPDKKIAEIEMVSVEEKKQVLYVLTIQTQSIQYTGPFMNYMKNRWREHLIILQPYMRRTG